MKDVSPYQRLSLVLDEYLKKSPSNTIASFQKEFGLPNAFFSNAEKNGRSDNEKALYSVTYKNLHKAQPLLNIEWIKTGNGEMWLHDEEENVVTTTSVGRPYYNVDFLGGFDLMLNDHTGTPEEYMSVPPYNKDDIYWCNLTGDSMSPRIISGARICLKHIVEGVNGIIYGKVYALVTKNNLRTVKWVVRANDENKIRLIPENKDPKYGDYQDIYKSDIIQVFKVEFALNPV